MNCLLLESYDNTLQTKLYYLHISFYTQCHLLLLTVIIFKLEIINVCSYYNNTLNIMQILHVLSSLIITRWPGSMILDHSVHEAR